MFESILTQEPSTLFHTLTEITVWLEDTAFASGIILPLAMLVVMI